MGICAQQHRVTTGLYYCNIFNHEFGRIQPFRHCTSNASGKQLIMNFLCGFGLILYLYFLLLMLALCIEISLKKHSFRSYPMKLSFYLTASEISPTILIILLILHLFKTTKNTNPLKQIKTVFCINIKKTSICSIVELLNTHIGLNF